MLTVNPIKYTQLINIRFALPIRKYIVINSIIYIICFGGFWLIFSICELCARGIPIPNEIKLILYEYNILVKQRTFKFVKTRIGYRRNRTPLIGPTNFMIKLEKGISNKIFQQQKISFPLCFRLFLEKSQPFVENYTNLIFAHTRSVSDSFPIFLF